MILNKSEEISIIESQIEFTVLAGLSSHSSALIHHMPNYDHCT